MINEGTEFKMLQKEAEFKQLLQHFPEGIQKKNTKKKIQPVSGLKLELRTFQIQKRVLTT
jgi:hypothetical protein